MLKQLLKISLLITLILTPLILPTIASADCGSDTSSKGLAKQGIGQTGTDCAKDQNEVPSLASTAVSILSIVAGAAGVIVIILSGFKYITSGGDANKVGSAKTTLVYALIGLVIAVLAQFFVHYVINTANGAQPCPSNSKVLASSSQCG